MSPLFEPDQKAIETAVRYLMENIPPETWVEIRESMAGSGDQWSVEQHFGTGIYVRNLLRNGGVEIDGSYLESRWHELVEEAVKRKGSGVRGRVTLKTL